MHRYEMRNQPSGTEHMCLSLKSDVVKNCHGLQRSLPQWFQLTRYIGRVGHVVNLGSDCPCFKYGQRIVLKDSANLFIRLLLSSGISTSESWKYSFMKHRTEQSIAQKNYAQHNGIVALSFLLLLIPFQKITTETN